MKTKLILLASASYAKVFSDKGNCHLQLLRELEHPENRKKACELVSDRTGHYKSSGGACGAHSERTSIKTTEKDRFAMKVIDLIKTEMDTNGCHNWVLISDGNFYGFLKKHLTKPIEQSLELVIKKNPAGINEGSLKNFIHEHKYAA